MFSEPDIVRFVGRPAFDRGDEYQRQGRVSDARWSDDRRILTGRVRGSARTSYSSRIRMQVGDRGLEPVVGVCDCPVGGRCKHVGALLLDALRASDRSREVPRAAWRRTLDPILGDPGAAGAGVGTPLGLQFELAPETVVRSGAGRFAGSAPKSKPSTVVARPVVLGPRGRWRRTGITWRDIAFPYGAHDWDERQVRALRELHASLTDTATAYGTDTWLPLDRARGASLWTLLDAARREGVAFVTGGSNQVPLTVEPDAAIAAVDVTRGEDGLRLTPVVVLGDPRTGRVVERPSTLIGEPAIGVATWPEHDGPIADAVLRLVPFEQPVAAAARGFLQLDEPIRIPAEEEGAFLAEHFRRLARLLPIVSRDGTFDAPAAPEPTLVVAVRHGARLAGEVAWRYAIPDDSGGFVPGSAERVPLGPDARPEIRDPRLERRILDRLAAAGVTPVTAPALFDADSRRLADRFEVTGLDVVAFGRDVLPALRRIEGLELVEEGRPVDYREAASAPVVSVGTTERDGETDWFDLDIEVRVADDDGHEEPVPIAELFRALARGDELLVAPSGLWFRLDGEVFDRLRAIIAEARELADQPGDALRISKYQASLWEDLVGIGVVTKQAAAWREAAAVLGGFDESGGLVRQRVAAGFRAELRPYQQAGYDWLSFLWDNRLGGVLADDMGLGKTVQALALVARAIELADEASAVRPRFLVVAPTSVVPNWVAEARRFVPGLAVVGLHETSRKTGVPLSRSIEGADIVVTSYALLRIDEKAYGALQWGGLLLDEAQFVKNRNTTTHAAVRSLAVPFKLAMTGTPLENTLMDLWSILSITAPGLFPSPSGFADYYQRPIEKEGDAARLAQLRRRIRPLLLRRTKELVAAELPPKLEQVLEVELGEEQRAIYDRYLARERQRVLGLLDEFGRNRFAVFRALTMLRQAALDASLVDADAADVPSAKLDLLDELLADALDEGHRVLVFSQFTRLLTKVRDRLDDAGIAYAYLDGSTTRRGEVVERFRRGEAGVFLISLKAGGFGLNLTEADYCVLLDPWWNPAAENQAVDRAHRIGQDRPVHVYRLIAKDTIEEKVMALKASKAALFDAVLENTTDAAASAAITAQDVRDLLG